MILAALAARVCIAHCRVSIDVVALCGEPRCMKARPIKPGFRPHCYVCGATDDLTDDHLPPRGFFPPTDRDNLITAPLCSTCHTPLAKMDENMRVWLAAAGGKSRAGHWIWKNKVMGSTFRRSPKLLAYIREKHFRPPVVDRQTGELAAGMLTFPQADAVPFIRRLTKGILYAFHPEYDYFTDNFAVAYRAPTDSVDDVVPLVSRLPQTARGNGVFRVWHGLTVDTQDAGACVYLFYEAVCFVCFYGKGETYKQRFAAGYKERDDLPEYL
jgi:hypothetical protein